MSVGTVDARLSEIKSGRSVVRVQFLTASLWGQPFSDMVSVVACHARDRGSIPVGLQRFFPLELLYIYYEFSAHIGAFI